MKAIIALGNPEVKYSKTRHNAGFMVANKLLGRANLQVSDKFQSFFAKDKDILYVMPKTYMNLSGRAAVEVMNFFKLSNKDILVIYDDIALDLGTLRFRPNGSDGGHNGIKSIINCIGTQDFDRLKVGVGPQAPGVPSQNYVLANFPKDKEDLLDKVLSLSADAALDWAHSLDFVSLQNKYNKAHWS